MKNKLILLIVLLNASIGWCSQDTVHVTVLLESPYASEIQIQYGQCQNQFSKQKGSFEFGCSYIKQNDSFITVNIITKRGILKSTQSMRIRCSSDKKYHLFTVRYYNNKWSFSHHDSNTIFILH